MENIRKYVIEDICNYIVLDYFVGNRKYWKEKYDIVINQLKAFNYATMLEYKMISRLEQHGFPIVEHKTLTEKLKYYTNHIYKYLITDISQIIDIDDDIIY